MLDGSSSPEMHPSSEVVNFFGMFRSTPKKHSFLESTRVEVRVHPASCLLLQENLFGVFYFIFAGIHLLFILETFSALALERKGISAEAKWCDIRE